jgi:hypothetical protein
MRMPPGQRLQNQTVRGSNPLRVPPVRSQTGQRKMEPLWSRAGATGRNRWQIEGSPKRLKQAKTVAVGCDRLPERVHGKEGVDGSSPSEGFAERPANWRFSSPSRAPRGCVAGTCLVLATHRDSPFWHRSDTASISIVGEDLQIERLCPIVSVGEEPDPLPAERGSAVRVRQRAQQRRHAERWRTHRLPGQLTTEDAARRSR